MFRSVVWFCSQISKVEYSLLFIKTQRNSWVSHYFSGLRLNARTKSTFIKRIQEVFLLFYVTDLQPWPVRWTAFTDSTLGADIRETRSQNRNHYTDRNANEQNRTMAQAGSKRGSRAAKHRASPCATCPEKWTNVLIVNLFLLLAYPLIVTKS